jgi:hypothetical protein
MDLAARVQMAYLLAWGRRFEHVLLPLPASPNIREETLFDMFPSPFFLPLNLGGDIDEGDRGGMRLSPI